MNNLYLTFYGDSVILICQTLTLYLTFISNLFILWDYRSVYFIPDIFHRNVALQSVSSSASSAASGMCSLQSGYGILMGFLINVWICRILAKQKVKCITKGLRRLIRSVAPLIAISKSDLGLSRKTFRTIVSNLLCSWQGPLFCCSMRPFPI